MLRRFDFRAVLIAVAFFTVGFLVADRMTRAEAAPRSVAAAQDGAAAFSGQDGALVVKANNIPYLILVRGSKIYRVDATGAGNAKPNFHIVE